MSWLVAAPTYLESRGEPRHPQELESHDGLMIDPVQPVWRLTDSAGNTVEASPMPRFHADESVVLLEAARAGLGIACLPAKLCRSMVADGVLKRVLPGWTAGGVTTTLLTHHRRGQLPSVRAVADFLVTRFRGRSGQTAQYPASGLPVGAGAP